MQHFSKKESVQVKIDQTLGQSDFANASKKIWNTIPFFTSHNINHLFVTYLGTFHQKVKFLKGWPNFASRKWKNPFLFLFQEISNFLFYPLLPNSVSDVTTNHTQNYQKILCTVIIEWKWNRLQRLWKICVLWKNSKITIFCILFSFFDKSFVYCS